MKREVLIQPYMPDYTEMLGATATNEFNDQDIGKAVKYSGDQMVLCAAGDEICGFVTAVEPYTKDGYSVGSVRKTGRIEAADEAGTLNVGDLVVAGTPGTLGTYALQNVQLEDAVNAPIKKYFWEVVAVKGTGAGRTVVLERI